MNEKTTFTNPNLFAMETTTQEKTKKQARAIAELVSNRIETLLYIRRMENPNMQQFWTAREHYEKWLEDEVVKILERT